MKTFPAFWFLCSSLIWNFGCGMTQKGKKNPVTPSNKSPTEILFERTAKTYALPERMLVAIAYVESRFAPQQAQNFFAQPSAMNGESLEEEFKLYGDWLKKSLIKTFKTYRPPGTIKEKTSLLWQISQVHKEAVPNLRVLFFEDLMNAMNQGFYWTDPQSGDLREFEAEPQALSYSELGLTATDAKTISKRKAQVSTAVRFPSSTFYPTGPKRQVPLDGILVIHCPFGLTQCVNVQEDSTREETLWAHYVVPQEGSVLDRPLQVRSHDWTIAHKGHDQRIIISLVGESGVTHKTAKPNWYSHEQLKLFGELVDELCRTYSKSDDIAPSESFRFDMKHCKSQGVQFQVQTSAVGDNPHFDEEVFSAYLTNLDDISGQIRVIPKKKRAVMGEEVPLTVKLPSQTSYVRVERFERCSNEVTAWNAFLKEETPNDVEFTFKKRFYDAGVNGEGLQFLRVKAYDVDGVLKGWNTTTLKILPTDGIEPRTANAKCTHD